MLCTIIRSDDASTVFSNIEDMSEEGLREKFGLVDGEENARTADYEVKVRDDGKRVHIFFIDNSYMTDTIWIIEG